MKSLPRFTPGMKLSDLSASELGNLVDCVGWMYRQMHEDRGVVGRLQQHPLIRGGAGLPSKIVVITEAIKGTYNSQGVATVPPRLRCREVKYRDGWARPCDGEGESEKCYLILDDVTQDMHVWPGKKAEDYEDDVFEGTSDDLDTETTYFTAHWIQGRWLVEKPSVASAEIDYCVILQTSGAGNPASVSPPSDPTLGAWKLRVQRVHLNDSGVYEAKGSPIVATTRPNCPGTFYDDYRRSSRNGTIPAGVLPTSEAWTWSAHANMVTFLVVKSDGVWIVEQPPPLVTRTFPAGTASGCSTV